MSSEKLDVEAVRKQFPALSQPQVYFDNAGGSQILGTVIESIDKYLATNNVQLGATYKIGTYSTEKCSEAVAAAANYINASTDEIVIGPSTTQLFRNLSVAMIPYLAQHPEAELVISSIDHEANIAAWAFLASTLNLTLKWWTPSDSRTSPHLTPASLTPLLTPNTFLVTCTHTSNILGTITDIPAISRTLHAHSPGALLAVDGVAYAPHRPLDLPALGADFYAFSWYKVYGPHVAQLYASRAAQDRVLASLGHYFKEGWTLEEKLGLGGASYELLQALPAVVGYLSGQKWEEVVAHEVALQEVLLGYLRGRKEVYTVFGEEEADGEKRVPVVSFKVKGRDSRELVEAVERRTEFGFRWGHFYSKRLVEGLLGCGEDGVVRVSMLHYNTIEEIEKFVEELDREVMKN